MNFIKQHRWALAVTAVVALAAFAYLLGLGVFAPSAPLESPAVQSVAATPPSGGSAAEAPLDAPVPVQEAPLTPAARELQPLMAATLSLRDGGLRREFQLSTREVLVREGDGVSRIVSLPPTDSPQVFAASLESLRAGQEIEPELVLYPAGLPQNEATRRIVTREVVINAPSRAAADALAAAHELVFKKAPEFAPTSFIYEAATSAKVLAILADQSATPEITPLLASRAAPKAMPNDPYIQLQWHLKYQGQAGALPGTDINVESVWNFPSTDTADSLRGRGVVIGIVDDGMEWNHPDLKPNARPDLQKDWNGDDNDPTPFSFQSHGTACGGVAAGRGNNRLGVSGVAPEAGLAGLRLIAGFNTDLDTAEAMTWKMGDIHILSNSWGPIDTGFILEGPDPLTLTALKYAVESGRNGRGTIITFAGGNGRAPFPGALLGNDNSNYDGFANSIYTIAVAAMDSLGRQSSYSEKGANLVVAAPSDGGPLGIMTTDNIGRGGYNYGVFPSPWDLPPNLDFLGSGDVTQFFGGTSSATPAVSGVIALMLEKNPNLGWRDVQEILMRSANKINPTDSSWKIAVGPDNINHSHKFGAGLVNATAAVALSGNWTNLAPQKNLAFSLPLAAPQTIAPGQTITRSFFVPDSLRTEHATLAIQLPGIYKGHLQIELTSPAGTTSVLCEPHGDHAMFIDTNGDPKGFVDANANGQWDDAEPLTDLNNNGFWDVGEVYTDLDGDGFWSPAEVLFDPNTFEDWTFMTVRNWGENSFNFWKLTIRNTGPDTGNLTAATLTVFGTEAPAPANPLPVVNLEAKRFFPTESGSPDVVSVVTAAVGTKVTLIATATDKDASGNAGSISRVEFFSDNGTGRLFLGEGTPGSNNTFTFDWLPTAEGNHFLTATAYDSDSFSATSSRVLLSVQKAPFVAWDFDTLQPDSPYEYYPEMKVPLEAALQSLDQYSANFRKGSSIVAAWEVSGVSGGNPLAPARTAPSANVSSLALGTGISAPSSATANAWGGLVSANSSTLAAALGNHTTASFEITPTKPLARYALHSIDAHNFLRNATGPTRILWQYGLNGTFTNIDIPRIIGSNLMTGNPQAAVALDQIPALQELRSGQTLTLRMVLFGGNQTGNWFLNNKPVEADLVLRAHPPRLVFDGTLGSRLWSATNGEIWSGPGTETVNALADSRPSAPNSALALRAGKNLAANDKSLIFQVDMTNAKRLRISYAVQSTAGGFTTHAWHYWDAEANNGDGEWHPIPDSGGNHPVAAPAPGDYQLVELEQIPGLGFNGYPDARIRLTVSGATAVNGTNHIDNIRFNAAVAP